MANKIILVQFDYNERRGKYERLLNVCVASIKKNVPDAEIIIRSEDAPNKINRKKCFASNTLKLGIWLEEMAKCEIGDNIVFSDCDMLYLKSPFDVFEREFDIAYTERPRKTPPVNGGIVFVKNNERSLGLMELWKKINDRMYNDEKFHSKYRTKYAGMNQAAFGWILENPSEHSARMIGVPCEVYNCCNETWHRINDNTRIVHIKGELRESCISGKVRMPSTTMATRIWNTYLAEIGERRTITEYPMSYGNRPVKKPSQVPMPKKAGGKIDESFRHIVGRQNKRRLFVP